MQLFAFGHPCEHQLRRTCIGGVGCPLNGYPDMWCCSFIKGKINFKRERPCEGQRCRWNFTHPTQTHFDAVTIVIQDGRNLAAKVEDTGPCIPPPSVLTAGAGGGGGSAAAAAATTSSHSGNHPPWDMAAVTSQEFPHVGEVVFVCLQMLRNPAAACARKLGQLFAYGAIKSHDAKSFGVYLKSAKRKTNDLFLLGAYDYLSHVAPHRSGGRKKQGDAADDLRSEMIEHLQQALTHNGALTDKDDQRQLQIIFILLLRGFIKNKRKAELLEVAVGKFPVAAQRAEAAEAAAAAAAATAQANAAAAPAASTTILTPGGAGSAAAGAAAAGSTTAASLFGARAGGAGSAAAGAAAAGGGSAQAGGGGGSAAGGGGGQASGSSDFSENPRYTAVSRRPPSSTPLADNFARFQPITLPAVSDLALLGGLFSLLGGLDGGGGPSSCASICGPASHHKSFNATNTTSIGGTASNAPLEGAGVSGGVSAAADGSGAANTPLNAAVLASGGGGPAAAAAASSSSLTVSGNTSFATAAGAGAVGGGGAAVAAGGGGRSAVVGAAADANAGKRSTSTSAAIGSGSPSPTILAIGGGGGGGGTSSSSTNGNAAAVSPAAPPAQPPQPTVITAAAVVAGIAPSKPGPNLSSANLPALSSLMSGNSGGGGGGGGRRNNRGSNNTNNGIGPVSVGESPESRTAAPSQGRKPWGPSS